LVEDRDPDFLFFRHLATQNLARAERIDLFQQPLHALAHGFPFDL
jgi:hypothetical protein